jgi:Domain of unknown function (DUF4365)
MMTQAHRQEALCRAYVQSVAAQAGLLWSKTEPDYGVDLSLRSVSIQENRRRDVGVQIDLQLKSTTRAVVTDTEVRYDLDVQTYNDLRDDNGRCPRLLVVLIMPAEEARWLSQTPEELTLRHCAYWISLKGYPPTTAASTIRIAIPLTNIFSVAELTRLMQQAGERKDP